MVVMIAQRQVILRKLTPRSAEPAPVPETHNSFPNIRIELRQSFSSQRMLVVLIQEVFRVVLWFLVIIEHGRDRATRELFRRFDRCGA